PSASAATASKSATTAPAPTTTPSPASSVSLLVLACIPCVSIDSRHNEQYYGFTLPLFPASKIRLIRPIGQHPAQFNRGILAAPATDPASRPAQTGHSNRGVLPAQKQAARAPPRAGGCGARRNRQKNSLARWTGFPASRKFGQSVYS